MIVLDASAAVEILLTQPRASATLRARLSERGQAVHVPHLFDLEVTAAIRRSAGRMLIDEMRAATAMRALEALRTTRYPHFPLLRRVWELRENITPYDAAYVALAEALDAPLVTTDAALAAAPGIRAEVELHPPA